jgi:uncharacterized integral membrane protein
MNAKVIFKTIFLVAVALLLVLMGMKNQEDVSLSMPPLMPKVLHQPAAIMYVGFFGVGFLSGAILMGGGGKKGGGKSKGD